MTSKTITLPNNFWQHTQKEKLRFLFSLLSTELGYLVKHNKEFDKWVTSYLERGK